MTGSRSRSAAGSSSISLVQNDKRNEYRAQDPWLVEERPELYMTMIETAEIVAERYQVTREAQDEYALLSQQRTAAAQIAGRLDQEIVPLPTTMRVDNRDTGDASFVPVTLDKDEGNRPSTTLAGLAALKPVFRDGQRVQEGRFVTAGNASQLSDGASASLLMEAAEAERRGLQPLGAYRGMAVAGCAPDEMGIGPVFAVPKLLAQHGLTIDDIGLWELNEAFAVQALYCRDRLGIDPERYNVDGGADLDRPPLRHVGRAHGWPRADRRQAARRAPCHRDDVRRRWHGGGRSVRSAVRGSWAGLWLIRRR